MKKSAIKIGGIPDETVVAELRSKGVLYEGPDHYVLHGGDHTDCFFYPFRIQSVVTLPLRLRALMNGELRDCKEFSFLAVSDTATRMMRSMLRTLDCKVQKVYPKVFSAKMELQPKQIKLLQNEPFIIMDDVVRKGIVLERVVDLCKTYELVPEGIFCAINAGISDIEGVPVNSLLEHPIKQWSGPECPLCKEKSSPAYDPYRFKR